MITRNCSLDRFGNQIKKKKIICFGAGLSGRMLVSQLEDRILDEILYFVDNDEKKWGGEFEVNGRKYIVKSPEELKKCDINNTIIFITSRFWDQIHVQLEKISELKNIECFVYFFMKAKDSGEKYIIPEGPSLIPKKIHYCWFGENALSENELKCIESWKKFCPDYEIIRWDEHNYDCKKNRYLREIYECGHYTAVSDYARIDILNEIGGIYLDTDVEIVRNIDELLRLPAYMGFEVMGTVNTGHGFGAVSGNAILKEMLDYYNFISNYDKNDEFDFTSCPAIIVITSEILKKHGLISNGRLQKINDITIFPNDYFDPVMQIPGENTYSIHRYSSLWSLKGMNMRTVWRKQREYWEYLNREGLIEDL